MVKITPRQIRKVANERVRLALIREAVAKDGMNLEDAYADRAWLLSKYDQCCADLAERDKVARDRLKRIEQLEVIQ